MTEKKPPGAVVNVAGSDGVLRPLQDRRFDTEPWPITFTVPQIDALEWQQQLDDIVPDSLIPQARRPNSGPARSSRRRLPWPSIRTIRTRPYSCPRGTIG